MPTSSGLNWGFTNQTYTPYAQQDIMSAMRRATDVSNLPFQPYLGQTVAGFAPSEIAAMQGIYGVQGYAQPYIDRASELLGRAQMYADPSRYSQQSLQQYYNPYQKDVIDATMANIAQENLRQQNDLTARAIQQGGFGSDRTGIARAELNRLQNLQNAQTLSGLQAQGYQQAQAQYNLAQQRAIEAAQSGAYSLGQLGTQGQQAAMQGLQALMGVGQMERALGQAQLEDQFKRFMTAQGYPWETAQWLASIVGSLAPQAGGTTSGMQIGGSSQTTPGASPISSIAGLATSGLGGLLKLIPGFGGAGAGAKDGGRIEKADGGGFGDIMSLGLESPWYGFDPERINEEKKRQWLSRQDVEQTADQQIKDRSWLNPDETIDPYQNDDVGYEADGGPVLRNYGGRTGYKGGGGPYEGAVPYVSGDTVGFIDNLKLPSPPSPHIPKADFLSPPKTGDAGGDSFGDIGKSLGSLTRSVSSALSKKSSPAATESEAAESPGSDEQASEEQYGGRVNMADGGGFADWLAGLRGDSTAQAPISPYMKKPATSSAAAPTYISDVNALYKNVLGREADPEGLAYWNQQLQNKMLNLGDIARYFTTSGEAAKKYGTSDLGSLTNLIQSQLPPTPGSNTLLTTGGAPIVNPDGSPLTLANVQTPSAVQGEPGQGLYSEGDISAAGQVSGPDPGLMMMVGQNPMMAVLINQQQQQKQEAANQKVAQMRAHNASIYNTPRSPVGYFMNLDYSVMGPNGLFGFNPISPYYEPLYPTANAGLSPAGQKWARGGLVDAEKPKGFDLGGMPSAGQLPNVMTGHGSQTNPSSFQPGYNPAAFYQQRADGGRTEYADGGAHGSFYNSIYNAVLKAAQKHGAPHPEVLARLGAAQAAHESGWGKHAPGNNYFGIKGPGRSYATHEVIGGKNIGTRASFRGYDSMQSSANDYVRLMASSPRYRNVFNADTPQKAFAAQSHSGYATDPNYGSKLAKADLIGSGSTNIASQPYSNQVASNVVVHPTRPLTGERAIPRVKKGFSFADLNPVGTAEAAELTAPRKSFSEAAAEMRGGTGGYGPGIWERDTPLTAFGETARKGDMLGDVPYAVTMAGSPMSTSIWDGLGFGDVDKKIVSEEPVKEPAKEATEAAPRKADEGKGGTYYGDWRDYEPWKSDPIGGFIDELIGDVPRSKTIGKRAETGGADIDLGGLADLFKGFSHGGRAHYDAGGPADIEDLDPELFSPEPMTEPKGFDLGDEEAPTRRIVATDDEEPSIETRPAPKAAAAKERGFLGLGDTSSLGDALITAGFGMMAGRSPNAWQNIGMGGLKGMEAYQVAEATKARREGELAKIREKEREAERSRDYLRDFLNAPTAADYAKRPAKIEASDSTEGADSSKLDALYEELGRYQKSIAMAPDAETARRLKLMQDNIKFQIQRAEREKSGGLGKIGVDELGNDIIGWTSGPRAGQPLKQEATTPSVDWTQSGDAFLEQLPPGTQSLVKSIAEGRAELPRGFGSAKTQPLFKMVTQYDPSFSMGEYQKRNQLLKQYADTSPTKAGGQLLAANTAIAHAGTVLEAADRLGNVGFKPFNVAKHALKSATTGDPAAVEFQQASEALNNELEKFFKGGSPADAAIRRAHDNLNTAQTPQEYVSALHTMVELLHGRSNELKTRWDQAFKGKGGDIPLDDFRPTSDRADEVTKRIEQRYEQLTGKKSSVSSETYSGPIIQDAQGRRMRLNKDRTGWEPL